MPFNPSTANISLLLLLCATHTQAIPGVQLEALLARVEGVEGRQAATDRQVVGLQEDLRHTRDDNQELRRTVAHLARNLSKVEANGEGKVEGGQARARGDRDEASTGFRYYKSKWEEREQAVWAEREAAWDRKWQTRFDALEQQVALLLAELARRKLQSNGPASQGEFVSIFKRSFSRGHLSATTDPDAPASPGGHRRWLQELLGCDLSQRSALINTECCAVADCSGDKLRACDERCAAVLLPFWAECSGQIPAATAEVFREAVDLCPALPGATSSAVREFQVVCPSGVVADDCIPKCDASINGDLLLLNMEGDDTKVNTHRDQCKHPA